MSQSISSRDSFETANTSLSTYDNYLPLGSNRSFSYSSLTKFFNSSNNVRLYSFAKINKKPVRRDNRISCIDQEKDLDDLHSYNDDDYTSESISMVSSNTDIQNMNRQMSSQLYTVIQNQENDFVNIGSANNIKRKSIFLEIDNFTIASHNSSKSNNVSFMEKRKHLLFSGKSKSKDKNICKNFKNESLSLIPANSNTVSTFSAKQKAGSNYRRRMSTTTSDVGTFKYYKMRPMYPMHATDQNHSFFEKDMELAFSKLERAVQNYPFFDIVSSAVLKVTLKFVLIIQKYTTRFINPVGAEFYFASCRLVKKYLEEKLDPVLLSRKRFHWIQDYIYGITEFQIYISSRCGDIPHIYYYYQFLDRIKDILYSLYPCIRLKKDENELEIRNAMLEQFFGYPNPVEKNTEREVFHIKKTIKDRYATLKFKLLRNFSSKSFIIE